MKPVSLFIVLMGIMVQACTIISFRPIRNSEQPVNVIELSPDIRLALTGAVLMNIAGINKTEFLPSSIKIEFHDKLIYIDPVGLLEPRPADFIFITHSHPDHFSKVDVNKLLKDETVIVGPEIVTKKLKGLNTITVGLQDVINLNGVKCKVIAAYNLKNKRHSFVPHPKSDNNVGYILHLDSKRIYIAGDTDFIPEMKSLKEISLAFLPIGEGKTAMSPEAAAAATNVIQPHSVVPFHYELGVGRGEVFEKLVNENIVVKRLP